MSAAPAPVAASQNKGKGRALEEESAASPSYESYITRPAAADVAAAPAGVSSTGKGRSSTPTTPAKNGRRLYIGNLASSVDEFVLANTFSKYGKISKMDFLFHKTGPLKGKPRGYAFVEYATPEVSILCTAA